MAIFNRFAAPLFLLPLIACGGSSAPPASTVPTTSVALQLAGPAPSRAGEGADATPSVVVLAPGSAPRRHLRYTFKPVTETKVIETRATIGSGTVGGEMNKSTLPLVRTTLKIEPIEVSKDGELRYAFDVMNVEVVDDEKIDPKAREIVRNEYSDLAGAFGTSRVSPRGITTETLVQRPSAASGDMKKKIEKLAQRVGQSYVVFPEAEVGVGASWEVVTTNVQLGVKRRTRTVYTATKIEEEDVEVTVQTSIAAVPGQPMDVDGLSPRTHATLDFFAASGSGRIVQPLTHLCGSATNRMAFGSSMTVTTNDQKVSVRTLTENVESIRSSVSSASPATTAHLP